ncbi:hypothetical protein BH23CHL8_BH23CHL8_31020 [soil metagenome]
MVAWNLGTAIPQGRVRSARPLSWRPACMSADEHTDWLDADAEAQGLRPCVDCPGSWARERRAEGMCNGEAGEEAE